MSSYQNYSFPTDNVGSYQILHGGRVRQYLDDHRSFYIFMSGSRKCLCLDSTAWHVSELPGRILEKSLWIYEEEANKPIF